MNGSGWEPNVAGEAAGRPAAEAKAVGSQAAKVEDRQVVTAAVVARMGAKVGVVTSVRAAAAAAEAELAGGTPAVAERLDPSSGADCGPPMR